MNADNVPYDRYRASQVFSAANSSDSEPEANAAPSPKTAALHQPQRNKRKNFTPRCSNAAYAADGASAALDFAANDNLNNNVRRRKTLATRRLVVDKHSPMDLSKGNDSGNSNSDSDTDDYNDDDAKIPTSFSIQALAKPHVSDATGVHHQGQISDMREYAMNTMRELLGIYGLTSEVAESISRQLPIAAFSTGE